MPQGRLTRYYCYSYIDGASSESVSVTIVEGCELLRFFCLEYLSYDDTDIARKEIRNSVVI